LLGGDNKSGRHGAAGADDGAENSGLAASLQLGEAGVDAVLSGMRDGHGIMILWR